MLFKHSLVAKARLRRCWKWSKLIDSRRFHLHLVVIVIVHLRSVVARWNDGWDVPKHRCKCPYLKRTRWYLPRSELILPITRSANPKAKSTRLRLHRGKRDKQTNLIFAMDKTLAIEAPKRQSRWSMFGHCREPYALSQTVLLLRKYQQSWRRQSRRHCLTRKNHRWDRQRHEWFNPTECCQNDNPIVTHLTKGRKDIFQTMIRTRIRWRNNDEIELPSEDRQHQLSSLWHLPYRNQEKSQSTETEDAFPSDGL